MLAERRYFFIGSVLTQGKSRVASSELLSLNPVASQLQKNFGETPQRPEFCFYEMARQESTLAECHRESNPEYF